MRPGTYDITSLRYDEAPELYFEWDKQGTNSSREEDCAKGREEFRLSLQQLTLLKEKISENGLTNDILELMDFIRIVIEGREYGKFAFTRNLSMALQLIGEIGREEGISKEDCAFISIHDIYGLYASAEDVRTSLLYSVQRGKQGYQMTESITLPPMIVHPEDAMQFYYPDS